MSVCDFVVLYSVYVSETSVFDVAADCRVGIRKGNYFEFRINQTIMTVPAVRSFSVAVPEGLFLLLRICSLSSCNIVRVILYHLLLKFCHLGEISILAWHTWETSFLTNNVI